MTLFTTALICPDRLGLPFSFATLLAAFWVTLLATTGVQAQPAELRTEQVRHINAALAAYHNTDPVPSQRRLRFVYFLPSDRQTAPMFRERLTRVIEEAASFFDKQISGYGLQSKTIPLERADDGLLRFVLAQGKSPWLSYNSKDYVSGEKIRYECLPALQAAGLHPEQETIAVFTAVMQWDESKQRFRQSSPYQGSGDARRGFCWQIDAPPLDPLHLPEKSPLIDDGEFGVISIGKWNSLFIGGVVHELGHSLGLAHNAQRPGQTLVVGTSLMGMGNRVYGDEIRTEGPGTFLTFADAVRLVSHPLFSGSEKGLREAASVTDTFEALQIKMDGQAMIVTGRVKSQPATYAVIAYADPTGGGDYDAIATVGVPDASGSFRIRCTDLARNQTSALRLTAVKLSGDTFSQGDMNFSIDANGIGDVQEIRQQQVLAPVLAKLRIGRSSEAAELTAALPDDEPAKSLVLPMLTPPSQRPTTPDADAETWSLCDLRPDSAAVGWRAPAYDYSPEDMIIRIDGAIERRAIWAHAPSSYIYQLDPVWKSFQADCAVADGPPGTVVFIVKVDGIERWRSRVIKPFQKVPCRVNLANAKTLELITHDAGDGIGRDHGYWLNPTLAK